MSQLTHEEVSFIEKTFPITIVLDRLQSPANIGGIFRLADAFGVNTILLYQCEFDLSSNRFKRTARQTEKTIAHRALDDFEELKSLLHQPNTLPLAIEISSKSKAIANLVLPPNKEIILVVGSERYGVSQEVLNICTHYHITMYGKNSSMNVSHATAIALFEITKSLTSLSNN